MQSVCGIGISMKKETYIRVFEKVHSIPHGVQIINISGKILTYTAAVLYIAGIAAAIFNRLYKQAGIIVAVPAVSFILVSLFRQKVNAKRPYELYGFSPLIVKDTKGKSFPSRHVFSIFVIGTTLGILYPYMSIAIGIMGVLLAAIRVITGVHFPKDTIAGAVIGIVLGSVAYFI